MSLTTGIVDIHREMELSPSAQLVRSTWFARHLWSLMALLAATMAGAGWVLFGH